MTQTTTGHSRTKNDIALEMRDIEARINNGEKGQAALKKYARSLYREYLKAGEVA